MAADRAADEEAAAAGGDPGNGSLKKRAILRVENEKQMNIHVGNLPADLTEQELRTAFESCGTVESVEIITNLRTHEPLGYGFVIMQTEEQGLRAIETLNGTALKGKAIAVSRANRPGGRRKSHFKKPQVR